MAREPIDPTPFEPAAPESVRAAIADAREGRGPAAKWLVDRSGGWGQTGSCFAILRGHPEPASPEVVGWLVGMGMFGDDLHAIPDVMVRERHREAAPHAIDAFAAGIRAGVPPQPRQWKSIETILGLAGGVPDSLVDVLPIGLTSTQGLVRGVALRIAQRVGAPARAVIAAARADASGKDAKRLDEALEALGAAVPQETDPDDLLARLVAEWARTRDPALVEPLTTLGEAASRARGPLKARSKGELEGVWLATAAARDPADVARLMATPWPGAWKAALARVEALREFPVDPRIVSGLIAVSPQYTSMGSQPLHRAMAHLMHKVRDPASAEAIRQLGEARGWGGREYVSAAAGSAGMTPGKADPTLLAEAEATRPPAVDLDAVRAALWEDPSDVERRLVLADALQQAGDPRGEFIAVQLALDEDPDDAKLRRRASELLKANVDAWTGPLPGVDRASRKFERGFLVALRCTASWKALQESLEVREWRTVERLELEADHLAIAPLIRRMRALRVLACGGDQLPRLLWQGAGGSRIRVLFAGREWTPPGRPTGLPELEVFGQPYGNWGDQRALGPRLAALAAAGVRVAVFFGFRDDLGQALTAWRGSAVPELRLSLGYARRDLLNADGWRVRMRKDAPERVELAWGGGRDWERRSGPGLLATLAGAGFREAVVYTGRAGRDTTAMNERFTAAAGQCAIDVRLDGEPIDLAG